MQIIHQRTGADPDLRDRLNRSPREIATMRAIGFRGLPVVMAVI